MFRTKLISMLLFVCTGGMVVSCTSAVSHHDSMAPILYNQCIDYCLGMPEQEFKSCLRNPTKSAEVQLFRENGLYFIKGLHDRKLQAGAFEQMSLADLRFVTGLNDSRVTRASGNFNVLEGPAYADIRKLQTEPKFNGATFQVASNFNALETIDPEQDILKQCLNSYVFDPTQGPAAALGAPAGLIYRRYMLFNDLKDGECTKLFDETNGQLPCRKYGLGDRSVNLLSDMCREDIGIEMSPAGYVKLGNAKKDPSFLQCDDLTQIKIGCQRATQVVFGAIDGHPSKSKTMVDVVPTYTSCIPPYVHKQIINQVFVAAPDFGQGTNKRSKRADAWAKVILRAAYEGTLLMAARCGSRDVVLTWVGGGAFDNDPVWVVEILESLEPMIKNLGLKVTLAAYGFTKGQEAYRSRLEALVAKTDGTWFKSLI